MTQVKQRKGWRMSCDVVKVMERLENELCSTVFSSAHSPTFSSLHQRQSSFSSPSVVLPTSQLILQLFRCFILQPFFLFSFGTGSSLTSPGEPPMISINLPEIRNKVQIQFLIQYLPLCYKYDILSRYFYPLCCKKISSHFGETGKFSLVYPSTL